MQEANEKTTLRSDKARKRLIRDIWMNREYSWLLFDKRVLDQANDWTNPLLERCKFLSIFCSNLDEFFMVRVGSLTNEMEEEPEVRDNKTLLTAERQLEGISPVVRKLYAQRSKTFTALRRELAKNGIRILRAEDLTPRQREECRKIFEERVVPLSSLMVLDAKHPMMQFENMRNYMLFSLEKDGRRMVGVMTISPAVERLFRIGRGKKILLVPVEELVRAFGAEVFLSYAVRDQMMVRVTRNADFDTNMDDNDLEHDFSEVVKRKVESRSRMEVVRVEVDKDDTPLKETVLRLLGCHPKFCFRDAHFFDYKFLFALGNELSEEESARLRYPPFKPRIPGRVKHANSMIDCIAAGDVFLSYPYDSMSPVVDLLEECSKDPRVLSIKITIYRLANHSRIAEMLCRASENGKQVTVVIELCARFDEENNLYFAEKLREAGCTIIYGMDNYKVHSKIISIVYKQGGRIAYITHLGTGNYNESTSKQYTDLNILTADEEIGEDAVAFFHNIAICNPAYQYRKLLVAPETLKPGILAGIDGEIAKAKAGRAGRIVAKMNSLTDKTMLDKLAEASCAGVQIDLIVRGICCLIPGVPGKTENIRVISIVGRFLEHSRVYCFGEGEEQKMYISSADLMTRNVNKRVEIAAPVLDREIAERISEILQTLLSDNVKARRLCPDGKYRKVETLGEAVDAQNVLLCGKTA